MEKSIKHTKLVKNKVLNEKTEKQLISKGIVDEILLKIDPVILNKRFEAALKLIEDEKFNNSILAKLAGLSSGTFCLKLKNKENGFAGGEWKTEQKILILSKLSNIKKKITLIEAIFH